MENMLEDMRFEGFQDDELKDLSPEELQLLYLMYKTQAHLKYGILKNMNAKKVILINANAEYELSIQGFEKIKLLLMYNENKNMTIKNGDQFESLIDKLRKVYPAKNKAGRKLIPGNKIIKHSLLNFFNKYASKEDYTEDEIVEATKWYVNQAEFKKDDSYIRNLNYFICKGANPVYATEATSDLDTILMYMRDDRLDELNASNLEEIDYTVRYK